MVTIAAAVAGLLGVGLVPMTACARPGGGETVITERVSPNYTIFVIEDEGGVRRLRFGRYGVDQSAVKLDDPKHIEFAYMRALVAGLGVHIEAPRILLIGLGGGTFPRFVRAQRPDAHIDVVELDAVVAEVAVQELGFKTDPALALHIADGRAFIERARDHWDVIVLDAYSADNIPMALATRRFLEAVKRRLAPDGVVLANLWSEHVNDVYIDMLRTYEAVFPEVHVVAPDRSDSRVVMAFPELRGMTGEALAERARALSRAWKLRYDLGIMVTRGHKGPGELPVGGKVLEDKAN